MRIMEYAGFTRFSDYTLNTMSVLSTGSQSANKESIAPVGISIKVLFYYFFSPTTSSAINPIIGLITNERRNQPMKDRLFPEARKPISIQKATQRSTIMMTSYFFTFIRRCY